MARSSYKRTSSAQITTKPGVLTAYFVGTDGANNATVKIYDVNSSTEIADDNCIVDITIVAASLYGGRNILPNGLTYNSGLYVALSGAGSGYYFVEYNL